MPQDSGTVDWLAVVARCLQLVRERRPLVHHVTNEVTAEASANAVLALGGSAVMARDASEVEAVVDQASALVINLGTLTRERQAAAEKANRFAARIGRPIVIDPVGAGAIPGRDVAARRLLKPSSWAVLRANASELAGLVGGQIPRGRGVDAAVVHPEGPLDRQAVMESLAPVKEAAIKCAWQHEVHVAVTGPVDLVTDGSRVVYVRTGHPWLARITGAGCMASSVIGAVLGAAHERARLDSILEAAVAGLSILGVAAVWVGEAFAAREPSPPEAGPPWGLGTFRTMLFDALQHLGPEQLTPERLEIWEEKV